ncbi:LysE family transporter [Roseobacter sp. HKCCD9010]|nr:MULTISPECIES: LysE family translocator [unclassified Roseobacter]MBF9052234.1 LysE family transporter [Rhodobacterales bacterium HKCCD4356]NNV14073.1 LysE family transporter [Roseobacter sp. HKCCD7357]NNV18394.1 LysE family transporter [Roseobacter sp. HKCCD8768]NNV27833.1 LysE family transporter [Roseobacter sp. HKCCD8192]NNV32175.1 LysE family transporter [Roseobacter sp. HKCCD9061]
MIDLNTLLIFVPIALALNLTPGADMLFCLGQGAKSGPKAGVAASLGIATGSFIHALVGGLGLAALIAANPIAFEVIRWAGVGYLLYLAFQVFTSPIGTLQPEKVDRSMSLQAWKDGVLVCLLNPKVAIFMLALVPQFVDPEQGSVLVQFLIFGTILNIGGTVINALVGALAGGIGAFLARNRTAASALQYLTGFVFVGLAAKLAFDRRG